MATHRTSKGLHVTIPESYEFVETTALQRRRRKRSRRQSFRAGPVPQADNDVAAETDELLGALEDQQVELFDDIEIRAIKPRSKRDRRGRLRKPTEKVKIDVELSPDEAAVLLLEQDGVYSWELPGKVRESKGLGKRRGARVAPAKKRATFTVTVTAEATAERPSKRRGFIKKLIPGKIRAFVLKFVAGKVVEGMMHFLERNVEEGPVILSDSDPSKWERTDSLNSLAVPHDRPAKILLFVHGTFSSTVGSYGALSAYSWGEQLLDTALGEYDAIIGYDHRTLSRTPYENAVDLLEALKSVEWAFPPHFDVIAFSRGGLVFRSLVEQILPIDGWQAHFDRAVFVACTNGGTELADPDNWHALLDLYTNIAVAGTRVLGLVPQATFVSRVFRETIRGLGGFLKFIASAAVTEQRVPGLAAMDPDGPFVAEINQEQPGQPTPQTTQYFAITSEFDVRRGGPKEFSKRLIGMLADRFTDRLMGASNDLVVDKPSMTAIDLGMGKFIKDSFDFGPNPIVYHTVYFNQPQVSDLLTNWLQIGFVAANGGGPHAESLEPGGFAEPEMPAVVNSNIQIVSAEMPAAEVASKLGKKPTDFVVVRRKYGDETLFYGRRSGDVLGMTRRRGQNVTLGGALDLHEQTRSTDRELDDVHTNPYHSGARSGPEVVLRRGRPVGILSEEISPVDSVELVTRSRAPERDVKKTKARTRASIMAIKKNGGGRRRRPKPSKTRASRPPRPVHRTEPVKPVCHFHAEMPEQAEVGKVTSIEVLVSREEIERTVGPTAAKGISKAIDWQKKLIIQVMPRVNCKVVGERRIEIDPPAPEGPQLLVFDIKPSHTGLGEVWVLARQGQVPLVTLVLSPTFVKKLRKAAKRTSASASRADVEPLAEPLHQLTIFDRQDGNQWFHEYHLFSPKLKILGTYESKRFNEDKVKRETYVNDLYDRIEKFWSTNKSDFDKFMMNLRAFGVSLFDQLFPVELQKILWKHRNSLKSIQVISQEPFIPWELIHLKQPSRSLPPKGNVFLGEIGLVRWLHNVGWAPKKLAFRKGKAFYVIPDYPDPELKLTGAQKEATLLKKLLKARAFKPQESATLFELINKPGAFDVLHFACHGEATISKIWNAGLLMKGRMEDDEYVEDILEVTSVESFADLRAPDGNRPLVFLNACQAGRGGYKLTGTGGFAQAFLKGGAGAFVGTLWSVGDTPALIFAEHFYKALQLKKNFSEAALAARQASKKAGDATWLSYTVYAHPHGTMG